MFDTSNPGMKARLGRRIEDLSSRFGADMRALHYLYADGGIYCLDLDLFKPTKTELEMAVLSKLRAMSPLEVLPAAPAELWWRLAESDFVEQYGLVIGGAAAGAKVVVHREAHAD